ncbi:MAG: hypothetical protein ACRCWD_06015 [Culicoidibacterales bacterium]
MAEIMTTNGQLFADFISDSELETLFTHDINEDEDGDDFLFYFGDDVEEILVYGDIELVEETATVNFYIRIGEISDTERLNLLEYCNFFNDNVPLKLTLSTKDIHEFPGDHLRLTLSDTVAVEEDQVPRFVLGMFAFVQEVLDEEILPEIFEEDEDNEEA